MPNLIFPRRYCGIEPRHFLLFQNYCVSSSCFCAKINFSRSIPINFIPCENDTILRKLLSAVYTCSRIKCFLHSMSFKEDSFLYNNSVTSKIHIFLLIFLLKDMFMVCPECVAHNPEAHNIANSPIIDCPLPGAAL